MKTIKLFLCLIVAFIGINVNAQTPSYTQYKSQSNDPQKQEMHKEAEHFMNRTYVEAAHRAADDTKDVSVNVRNAVAKEASRSQNAIEKEKPHSGGSSTGYNGNSSPKNDGRGSSTGYSRNLSPKNDGGGSSTGYSRNLSPKNDGGDSSTGYSRNSSPKNDGGKKSSPEPKSKDNDCHTPQCEAAKAIENK